MGKALDWSEGWIKEGYYVSYMRARILYFERVLTRDFGHFEHQWASIAALSESRPEVLDYLEVTTSFNEKTKENQLWQVIWGMKGQALLYVELPTDTHRHGIPKIPKPRANYRRVSHYEEWMSPYDEPNFITEHFMMRPDLERICLSFYNPNAQAVAPLLNFFINKMTTERVGTVDDKGELSPTSDRWSETLDKLWRGATPCRPISLFPVTGPAEAHH